MHIARNRDFHLRKSTYIFLHGFLLSITFFVNTVIADPNTSPIPNMLRSDSAATNHGWQSQSLFTIGDIINNYAAPGLLDGLGAYALTNTTIRIFANHELKSNKAYAYSLANGTTLKGARISYFDLDINSLLIKNAGLAYHTIYDRSGKIVTHAAQINERGQNTAGLARLCSARSIKAGQYNFADDIFFSGEEKNNGTEWALDIKNNTLWAIPALGRGAWENVSPIATGHKNKIALLAGDDRISAPLYLYLGEKNALGDNSFLDRNGLKKGALYCWKANNGDTSPKTFNGFGASRQGIFIPLTVQRIEKSGQRGYDQQGYLNDHALRALAHSKACFSFSRPEDLHEDPNHPTRIAFASTGNGRTHPDDNWGTIYIADFDFQDINKVRAQLRIIHDADALAIPDSGIRNPDNLTWANDGYIYIQEDRATHPKSLFGKTQGVDASVWQLSPKTGRHIRIGEIDRNTVLASNKRFLVGNKIGSWESSGILDISNLVNAGKKETVLIGTVQAHGVTNDHISKLDLVQGGQIFLLKKSKP